MKTMHTTSSHAMFTNDLPQLTDLKSEFN